MPKCAFIKLNGESCGANALTGDRFCINHSFNPKARKIKASAVRKGGIASNRMDGLAS